MIKPYAGAALLVLGAALSAADADKNDSKTRELDGVLLPVKNINVAGSPYLRGKAGDADFGLAAKDGALRYYRSADKAVLIEYISLSEGDKAQLSIPYVCDYKTDWISAGISAAAGAVDEDKPKGGGIPLPPAFKKLAAIPFPVVEPSGGALELLSKGKLLNDWEARFKLEKSGSSNILSVSYAKRSGILPKKDVAVTVKFRPWLDDEGCVFLGEAKGGMFELQPGVAVKCEKVLVPFRTQGRLLELSCAEPVEVVLSERYPLRGGRTLEFKAGAVEGMTLRAADKASSISMPCAPLDVKVDGRNGAAAIGAGGMPLMNVECFEGEARQSRAGWLDAPWTVDKRGGAAEIAFSGKIETAWSTVAKAKGGAFELSCKRSQDGKAAGVGLLFPYWTVGGDVELELPDGSSIKEIGGVPLRVGMNLANCAELPAGSRVVIHPTASESLAVETKSAMRLSFHRQDASSYNAPFDVTLDKSFYANKNGKGVINSYPWAGMKLEAKEPSFGVNVKYARRFVAEPEIKQEKDLPKEGVEIAVTDDGAVVKSPYWRIAHSKAAGGGVSEIVFPHGSGRNILVAPERIYAMKDGELHSSEFDKSAGIEIDNVRKEVKVCGELKSKSRSSSGVKYEISYLYKPHVVERKVRFDFQGGAKVRKLGVLNLSFSPSLDQCGYKPCVSEVKKAVFPGVPALYGKTIDTGYISIFKTGCEGIDFVPGRDIDGWQNQISSERGKACFAVAGNSKGGAELTIEPYGDAERPVEVSGVKEYMHYLGLPMIDGRMRKANFYYRNAWGPDWVSNDIIEKLHESGISLMSSGFSHCAVGLPPPETPQPQDAKILAGIDRIVKASHERGMRVIPFVSTLLGKSVPVYKEKGRDWGIPAGNGIASCGTYGDYMCHEAAGWDEYIENQYMTYKKRFNYDGIYFDFIFPASCAGKHTDTGKRHLTSSSLLKFVESARGRLDFILGHTGYYPTFMLENLCDMIWAGEEMPTWYSAEGRIPSLDMLREHFEVVPNTQRMVESRIVYNYPTLSKNETGVLRYKKEDADEYLSKLALCGLFTFASDEYSGTANTAELIERNQPFLDVFRIFRDVDLSQYRFLDWKRQGAAIPSNPKIRAAVYWNDKSAIILFANSECASEEKAILNARPAAFGWGEDGKCSVSNLPDDGKTVEMSFKDLERKGLNASFKGFARKAMKIDRR